MPSQLTPIPVIVDAEVVSQPPTTPVAYATLTKERLLRLARAMPDCQSAVLMVLVWHAIRNAKMKRGGLAGRTVASVSGGQLAGMTGRPLRTIRHALSKLLACHLISKVPTAAGRKNIYAIPIFCPTET
jgi:hypothetical protein